jgi:5,10-methylenetetrahydrofolate reductase
MVRLTELLGRKRNFVSTEFLPPKSPSITELVTKTLKVANIVDAVSIPELKANEASSPKFRMHPFYTAMRLRDLTGVETVFHMTPRDQNKNAIAGLLMSAAAGNLKNILVIGGDRYSPSEHTRLSKNVYDFVGSTDLILGIRSLEKEIGNPNFCLVTGTDPTVVYTHDKTRVSYEVSKLIERQDAGADIVQTQPVFDLRYLEFLDIAKEHGLKIPILAGILPLRGREDCIEVQGRYGITIPSELKAHFDGNDEVKGREIAYELAAELVKNGITHLHVYPRENCDFLIECVKNAFA